MTVKKKKLAKQLKKVAAETYNQVIRHFAFEPLLILIRDYAFALILAMANQFYILVPHQTNFTSWFHIMFLR